MQSPSHLPLTGLQQGFISCSHRVWTQQWQSNPVANMDMPRNKTFQRYREKRQNGLTVGNRDKWPWEIWNIQRACFHTASKICLMHTEETDS